MPAPSTGSESAEFSDDVSREALASIRAAVEPAGDFARDGGAGDPLTIAIPPVESAEEAAGYFRSEGQPLLVFLEATAGVWRSAETASCASVMDVLMAGPSPRELLMLAYGAPDKVTQDVVAAAINTVGVAVATCAPGDDANAEAAWAWAIAAKHLDESGIVQ